MKDALTSELEPVQYRPRLGFLGAGWIGRHRLGALAASGVGEIAALVEPEAAAWAEAAALVPHVTRLDSLDALVEQAIDGLVIATPTALHADQAIAALERGIAVFCQKPLARSAAETRRVIAAAKAADRLLAVDHPFRYTEAMRVLRSVVQAGELGDVYAVEVVFHSASGPEQMWARDPRLSGGGCVIDLGTHMIDLALWTLGFPRITGIDARLFARGEPIRAGEAEVAEDYATALLDLDTGATVRLSCAWNLPAGRDAIIEASFYGTEGGGSFHNLNGSLHDFAAELFRGTSRHTLAAPPDEWAGRAAVDWATRLAAGERYDPWIEGVSDVAAAIDGMLGR